MTRKPTAAGQAQDLEPGAQQVRELTMILLFLTRWTEADRKH